MIALADALALLEARIRPIVGRESVTLNAAMGRILAEPLSSPRAVPAFDNVAVDGWAFAAVDQPAEGPVTLRITPGRSTAGHPFDGTVPPGHCLRVLTGAAMPAGTNTIVLQEAVSVEEDRITFRRPMKAGANRRRAGEDVAQGATLFAGGTRLRPQHIGVAAEIGMSELPVFGPLRIALFSSGDELREPGEALPPGGLFDANRHMLKAYLADLPVTVADLGILPDDKESVRAALHEAAASHDVILTSGGAAGGIEDHVVRTVERDGQLDFWRIAIKPGRPLAFGRLERAVTIGLPGNPVAVAVCFLRLARPVLLRLAGAAWSLPRPITVEAGFALEKKPGRSELVRTRLIAQPGGRFEAVPAGRQGSGILTSMTAADGLVELADELTEIRKGDPVPFFSFAELTA